MFIGRVKIFIDKSQLIGEHSHARFPGRRLERVDTINLGFPIGLSEEIAQWIHETTISLQPGDGIVLYTDGITEAVNLHNELYGMERLCEVVSQHWNTSAEEIKQAVIEDVIRFVGKQKIYDDLTLVIVKRQ